MVRGFGCVCGCRVEFKNVVVLLMDKIYKLREERNLLREEMAFRMYTPREENKQKIKCEVATSTDEMITMEELQKHLATVKSEDKEGICRIEE